MILDSATKLEAVLAGAVSANQPEFHVTYIEWNNDGVTTPPTTARGALNSASDVALLAAPTMVLRREIQFAAIYNKDTAPVTLTLKTDDGTERIVCRVTLATLESLHYALGKWFVLQANGAIKEGSGITGPASSTDNAVVRWDGATGTLTQNSAFVVDDNGQVASFGGNIKFPASASASADVNTLDDYEEGTWTPTIVGTVTPGAQTYTVQVGTYTKIGDRVFYSTNVLLSAADGTTAGVLRVSGLPFTSNTTSGYRHAGGVSAWRFDLDAGYTFVGSRVADNSTQLNLLECGDNVASAGVPAAGLLATSEIQTAGHYQV